MSVIIDDIKKKYVRKIITERQTVFYAVSISVCRAISSDGFVTVVMDEDHVKFENYKFVIDFGADEERTFKITDTHGYYTTAQLLVSDVAISHLDSVLEREREREAAHLAELQKVLYDTLYFSLYCHTDLDDKLMKSFKTEEELKKDVRAQVFKIIDTDLNNDILRGSRAKNDLDIYLDANGNLVIQRTTYKRNAFAAKNGDPEYRVDEVKETKYYVRNDKHMRISIWDWSDVLEDIKLRQIEDDEIFNEERTEEEWEAVKEIARKNAKLGCHNVHNLSKHQIEHLDDSDNGEEDILHSPFLPIGTTHISAAC